MKKLNLILVAFLCFACVQTFAQTSSLKVTSAGDVGIGTDTPDEKLEVVGLVQSEGGTIKTTGASASTLYNRTDYAAMVLGAGTNAGFTFDQNYDFRIYSRARNFVLNRALSAGKLILSGDGITGNVGIGYGAPTEKLHVAGNVFASGMFIPSDSRLKKDVIDFKDGLSVIKQLSPIKYQYNGKAGLQTECDHIGVFAQDLQKAAPYLVEEFIHEETNEEGEVIAEETYLKIHDSEIKYLLINAMKEQQDIIEDQATKIDKQADKLLKMENELAAIKALLTGKSTKTTLSESIDGSLIEKAQLGQNTPNPFDENTMIEYLLPKTVNNAQVAVYDNTGKMIKEVTIEANGQGFVDLKLTNLSAGTYHYSLIVDGKVQDSKKMILK